MYKIKKSYVTVV